MTTRLAVDLRALLTAADMHAGVAGQDRHRNMLPMRHSRSEGPDLCRPARLQLLHQAHRHAHGACAASRPNARGGRMIDMLHLSRPLESQQHPPPSLAQSLTGQGAATEEGPPCPAQHPWHPAQPCTAMWSMQARPKLGTDACTPWHMIAPQQCTTSVLQSGGSATGR